MGQYHEVVNLTKKQALHPHKLGDGIKLMEFAYGQGGTLTALAILLAGSNGRGGGDLLYEGPHAKLVGSWCGDRIAIVGDYYEKGDIKNYRGKENPYDLVFDSVEQFENNKKDPSLYPSLAEIKKEDIFIDISPQMREIIESDGCYKFVTEAGGWIPRYDIYKLAADKKHEKELIEFANSLSSMEAERFRSTSFYKDLISKCDYYRRLGIIKDGKTGWAR